MKKALSLTKALKTRNLKQFIKQEEVRVIGSAERKRCFGTTSLAA